MANGNSAAVAKWIGTAIAVGAIIWSSGRLSERVQSNTAALIHLSTELDQAVSDRYTGAEAARDWTRQERVDKAQNDRIDRLIELLEQHQ